MRSLRYTATIFVVLVATTASAAAQTFVYTNDDRFDANAVSAFRVQPDGSLVAVPGSPFPTGGSGSGGGFFAANRTTVSTSGNLLFASNSASADISVFRVDRHTGALTLVPGSPFPSGGQSGSLGISLAVTPNGRFLVAAHGESQLLAVFRVSGSGALAPVDGSPFPAHGEPDGIKITSDGKLLAVAYPLRSPGAVGIYTIGSTGAIAPAEGTPVDDLGEGTAAGVDINCDNDRLYVGEANLERTIVDVFALDRRGRLTPIAGSPFTAPAGANSNVVLLNPNDTRLYVSNQFSGTIVGSQVQRAGLSLLPGSPFGMPGGSTPSGMATDAKGKFLFVADYTSTLHVLAIARDGSLIPVPGSPFRTSPDGGVLSVAVFPAKNCRLDAKIDVKPGDRKNVINRRSGGEVRVALLSTAAFDARTADRATLRFAGAPVARTDTPRDVNDDGRVDTIHRFTLRRLTLAKDARQACLTGATANGRPLQGCDRVTVK